MLAGFDYRLALLRLDKLEGRPTVRADANALQKDARARKAGLILRRLESL